MNDFRRKKLIVFAMAVMMIATLVLQNVPEVKAATNKKVKKITLNYQSITMQGNDKVNLKVVSITPSNASKTVTWKSSDKRKATVSKKGVVIAKKEGKVTITAKAKQGGKTVNCKQEKLAKKAFYFGSRP